MKRGAHPEDEYLQRWVTLWPSRIGYTMKVTSGKYCNFIPLDLITEIVPVSDWSHDPEHMCDFVVKTVDQLPPKGVSEICTCMNNPDTDDEVSRMTARPRPYFLRASDVVERNQWMRDLRKCVRKAKAKQQENLTMPLWRRYQRQIRTGYVSTYVQGLSSILIFGNFLVNAYDAQINTPPGSAESKIFLDLDIFFTVVFTVELLWNMASFWFLQFWLSYWNLFDFAIIVVSLISLSGMQPSRTPLPLCSPQVPLLTP